MPIILRQSLLNKVCVSIIKKLATVCCLLLLPYAICIPVASADTGTLSVSATVISKNVCKFRSGAATLNFGALDPANSTDVTRNASMQFVCHGSAPMATFAFTTDSGLHESGPGAYRMQHATVTTEFLPYSLSLSPASGTVEKGVEQNLTLTGTVTSSNYRSAYAGNYSDTVVITLNP